MKFNQVGYMKPSIKKNLIREKTLKYCDINTALASFGIYCSEIRTANIQESCFQYPPLPGYPW